MFAQRKPASAALLPIFTSPVAVTTVVGSAFTYNSIAINNPTSFTATGLPAGLTFNSTTGSISGTPTAVGLNYVKLASTNSHGTSYYFLEIAVLSSGPIMELHRGNVEVVNGSTDSNISGLTPGTVTDLTYSLINSGNSSLTVGGFGITNKYNCTVTVTVTQPSTSVPASGMAVKPLTLHVTPIAAGPWSLTLANQTNQTPNPAFVAEIGGNTGGVLVVDTTAPSNPTNLVAH